MIVGCCLGTRLQSQLTTLMLLRGSQHRYHQSLVQRSTSSKPPSYISDRIKLFLVHSISSSNIPHSRHQSSLTQHYDIRSKNDDDPTKCVHDTTRERNIQGTIPFYGKGIQIGQHAKLNRVYNQDDINTFGILIGDLNPVHFPIESEEDDDPLQKEIIDHTIMQAGGTYEKPIVHGMLLASVFSTIFGTLIPGAIYRNQSIKFHHPVYVDENTCGQVVIKKLRQVNRQGLQGGSGVLCTCETTVNKTTFNAENDHMNNKVRNDENENLVCITGEAQVWLPGAELIEDIKNKV